MPNAPEVEHLRRAVEAVREALIPQRPTLPKEEETEEELEEERQRIREVS